MQHSALPGYSFNQNAIKRGEGIRTKMGVGEDEKNGSARLIPNEATLLQQVS